MKHAQVEGESAYTQCFHLSIESSGWLIFSGSEVLILKKCCQLFFVKSVEDQSKWLYTCSSAERVLTQVDRLSLHAVASCHSPASLRWCLCNYSSPLVSSMNWMLPLQRFQIYFTFPEQKMPKWEFSWRALLNNTGQVLRLLFSKWSHHLCANDFTQIFIWIC